MENKAVYAGSFDPITNGHLDIIERGSKLYDHLYITIFNNPNKSCLFSLDERIDLLKKSTEHLKNVSITTSDNLAVEYAKEVGANVLIRGLRATMDFEYELQLAFSNQYLDNNIEMVFLMTKPNNSFISSSTVKEIAKYSKSVKDLVPTNVEIVLKNKFKNKEKK